MATISVTNTFVNSTVADADEVNANFQDITSGLVDQTNTLKPFAVEFPSSTSGSSDAYSLDRYEEGTAEVYLRRDHQTTGSSVATASIRYQRTGNKVGLYFGSINDVNSGTALFIASLPFSSATKPAAVGAVTDSSTFYSVHTNEDTATARDSYFQLVDKSSYGRLWPNATSNVFTASVQSKGLMGGYVEYLTSDA